MLSDTRLVESCIVRMIFGSHLYGTNTPESDTDYKAVHLPSPDDILLQRVPGSVNNKRPKAEGERNIAGDVDEESFSLQRYLGLLADGQTVAIDMLFAPKPVLLQTSNLWELIYENRHRLLNKRSTAFVGYCRTQANKYGIKGSRVAAARNVTELLARELAEKGSTAKVGEIGDALNTLLDPHTAIVDLPVGKDGRVERYVECCNRKVSFGSSIKLAHEIFSRIYENYGKRAQLAERNEGIDWKALSHAVRVGDEAIELLQTGNITFPLRNARRILEIKQGLLPYGAVAEEIEGLLTRVEQASVESSLPETADMEFIDDLVLYAYRRQIFDAYADAPRREP